MSAGLSYECASSPSLSSFLAAGGRGACGRAQRGGAAAEAAHAGVGTGEGGGMSSPAGNAATGAAERLVAFRCLDSGCPVAAVRCLFCRLLGTSLSCSHHLLVGTAHAYL